MILKQHNNYVVATTALAEPGDAGVKTRLTNPFAALNPGRHYRLNVNIHWNALDHQPGDSQQLVPAYFAGETFVAVGNLEEPAEIWVLRSVSQPIGCACVYECNIRDQQLPGFMDALVEVPSTPRSLATLAESYGYRGELIEELIAQGTLSIETVQSAVDRIAARRTESARSAPTQCNCGPA